MKEFLLKLASVAHAILGYLVAILRKCYNFVVVVYNKILDLIESLFVSFMPTRTRILQETWVSGSLLVLFLLVVLIINISAFNLFRKDKIRAQALSENETDQEHAEAEHFERISEKRLLRRCFFGGAIGGYLAMKICRHKTLKPKFNIGVTVLLIIQLLLYSFVLGFFGFWLCFA